METQGHVLLTFLLLVALALAFAVNPGVNMRVTKSGIDYASTLAEAAIREKLQTLTIPDQNDREGKLTWSLTGIQNRGITGPNTQIAFSPANGGLTVTFSNLAVNLHADWRVKYKLLFSIRASGSIDAQVSGVSLSVTVGLGEKVGRPSISPRSCTCSIGSVRLNIHGGVVAFVLNLFKRTVENKVRNLLQGLVCKGVNDIVNGPAEQELAKLKVNVGFGGQFGLDYSLVGTPAVTGTYLETSHKGEIYWNVNRQAAPFLPSPIPSPADVSRMLYVSISEYAANTFAYSAHRSGFLKYSLTINNVPGGASFLQKITSQPGKSFPAADFRFQINSSQRPTVTMINQNLTASVWADVDLVVITQNQAQSFLSLNLTTSVTIQPSLVGEKLIVTITGFSIDFHIKRSDIGNVNEQDIKTVLREAIAQLIIPGMNTFGRAGIDLPVTGVVRFYNSNLSVVPGALVVSTDVRKL